jgi:hypothetical protein
MPICEFKDCKIESSFNFKGETRKFCNKHKEPGMINVKDVICIYENCNKQAYYNYNGTKEKLYCVKHKLDNMFNVKSKICDYNNCPKQAMFNYKNNIIGKFCFEHKEDLMVDVKHKHCIYDNCINRANYNYFGKSILYCIEHKLENMINVSSSKCKFNACTKYPNFNFSNQKNGLYCYSHKLENMIDVCNPRCLFDSCKKIPSFNYENNKTAIYCNTHKLESMINVKIIKCKTHLCDTKANKNYEGFCLRCYIHTYPDKPTMRNYKTKEQNVVDFINNSFHNLTIQTDKIIQDGCSKKRPDIQIDLGYQIIIIEIDENQHKTYDCSCENKRLMEISQDYKHRPIIFIRFNPDDYINNGVKVQSCWKILKSGILKIDKEKEIEWNDRLNSLKCQIEYWCNPNNITNKTIEVIQMYYNE